MARMRQPDDYHAQEEALLFNSLCLLDAPNAEGAKLLEFSRAMFRKPNAKALEFLLHFTYSLANGKAAAKKFFKGLWPLVDKDRKQAKEFYQRAQDWLKETGLLDGHGHSLSAFQRNPSGPKLVSFLVDLTDWALRIHHKCLFPQDTVAHSEIQDPALLLTLAEPLLTAARAQNQLQAERLLRACQQGARVQQQAEAVAGSLRDDYYSLTAQLAEAQRNGLSSLALEADSLHQDCSSSTELPSDLQAQQQQLQQLWAALEQHLQASAPLSGLVSSLAGSDVHPYAIDGLKLREDGPKPPPGTTGLAGLVLSSADVGVASNESMDVAALVEAWVADMATVCCYMNQLAGTDKQQQHSWGPLMGGGGGASVTPLVASSDAASHAPHLYAQLNLHRSCLEQLKSLKATLAENMAAAAERIQRLDSQLSSLMEAEEQRYLLMMEEAAGKDVAQYDVLSWLAGAQGHGVHHQQQQDGGGGLARGNLFAEPFPLVPPTPLLQQLVHRHQAGPGAAAGPPASSQLQQLLLSDSIGITPPPPDPAAAAAAAVPRRGALSPSDSSAAAMRPAAGGRGASPQLMGLCSPSSDAGAPAAAAAAVSDDDPLTGSPGGSSVSSAALPAAELLMAQDIMDVDLILSSSDDDGGGGDDDGGEGQGGHGLPLSRALQDAAAAGCGGGLSLPRQAAAAAAVSPPLQLSLQQAVRARDYSRMRISLELMHGQAGGEQLLAAEESLGDVSSLGGGGQAEQEATSRSCASGGVSFRQLGAGDERQQASRDTPRWAGQPGSTAGAGGTPGAAAAAAAAAAGVASCASVATDSPDVFAEPLGALLGHPGSDRLSSARPRRLTFAAAVSAEDSGGGAGSPGSSSSSADDSERIAAAATNPSAGLESLKQRFANLHKR